MSDIFREVDEDVRRDKAAEFWSQYQTYVYVAAAVIVLATAGYRFYDYRRTAAAEAAGAAFQQALKLDAEGKSADAKTSFTQLQNDAPAGYRVLARFAAAADVVKADPKAGAEAYDALANDSAVDPLFREAARLRAALARLDSGDVTSARGALETQHRASRARRAGVERQGLQGCGCVARSGRGGSAGAADRARFGRNPIGSRRVERAGQMSKRGAP